jgi:tetratricopeptide (TPR) repeat protein
MMKHNLDAVGQLREAGVLVELGFLRSAQEIAEALLKDAPDRPGALSLLAKIHHMRGELTQAIGCWSKLDALATPHKEVARLQLGGIFHLVKNPDEGGDFALLQRYQLARKAPAYLEIEEAFRRFLAGKPVEAQSRCRRVAQRMAGKDPAMYKLAVLADAWLAELSGDLSGACSTLEALGAVRGFEYDADRILALARVAEGLGTRDKLEAAVNICRYLDRQFGKMSVLSRLASLHDRLGEPQIAEEYRSRYLDAFRARMHRPSFADVIWVAAQSYLPLRRLLTLRVAGGELPGEASSRERALASALRGDLAAARSALDASQLLDQKYIADIDAQSGDERRATSGYFAVYRADPEDVHVLGALLHRKASWGPDVAEHFASPANVQPAEAVLRRALRREPEQASLWSALSVLLGSAEDAERCRQRAQSLERCAVQQAAPVGRVLAAAVYHFVGKAKGLIHEVWADRLPAAPGQGGWLDEKHIFGSVTPSMRTAIQSTFLAVREYVRSRFPHRSEDLLQYQYTFKVTKDDEPSDGLSAGLPSAVAFLSVFLQRPVPQDVALSGMLITDAHRSLAVRIVGEAEFKVKAAYNRNLKMLILPAENRAELSGSREVPDCISGELVRYAADLDEALVHLFGDEVFSLAS